MIDCPKVSIIVLNWNGKDDTVECLESLKKITFPKYKIILVDNGSTDGSVEFFENFYPEIEIIKNEMNLGFAEGNNVALKWAVDNGTDYVLLLNNDVVVDPDFLSELIFVAENNQSVGVVGPTVYYYDNVDKIQSAGGKIDWNKGNAPNFITMEHMSEISTIRDVDYIMGCALLAKTELIEKIGYLNKHYFAYWEETDWCVRAQKAGYRIIHVPISKIWHKGGSTSQKKSGFYEYQMTRNMFWFMKRHATKVQYVLFLSYFFGYKFWLSNAVHLYHKSFKEYTQFLRGIFDGIMKFN